MGKTDDERSPFASAGAGEKCRKRSFRPEVCEEPQNVSDEARRSVSCLSTHQCGRSAATGKSELQQTLKQMTFTRSEAQHFISLIHSRTIEEEDSQNPLIRVEASESSGSIKRHKHEDRSDSFNAFVVGSRVLEEEIASPAEEASTIATFGQLPRQDSITSVASPQYPATMENLPDELLLNIFIRLMAKQLAQMRSVSKSWNALLSQSSFVKSHLNRSVQNNDEILLVFNHEEEFSCYKPYTAKPTLSPCVELSNFIKLPVNPQPEDTFGINVIGYVNGLICSSYNNDSVIHIWNPSLSAMLTLPPYSTPTKDFNLIKADLRFGFDPKTDDYKVVKLTGFIEPSKHINKWWLDVEIYSMRKGRWELISERFPSHITEILDETFSCTDGHNGYLHWLCVVGDDDVSDTIVAFDLGSETFSEIPLPFSTQGHNHENFIGVLGEKLLVMLYNEDVEYEVWVMEEYGVAESWVKRHVFSPSFKYSYPIGITSRGEYLVGDKDDYIYFLLLYDPSAKEQKLLKDYIFEGEVLDKIVEYVDSLVWVAPAEENLEIERCEV